jgi:hypothetical protein
MLAISGFRKYRGPLRALSSRRSMATKACPEVRHGEKLRPAGSEPDKRQVRKIGSPMQWWCGRWRV